MVASEQTLLTSKQLDTLSINTIRTLAIDAVQKANSGHPGAPMGLAPVAYCLWQQFLRFDPGESHLAQSRPLRALERPRFHVAVRDAVFVRGSRSQSRNMRRPANSRSRWMTSSSSARSTARLPDIPNTAIPLAWKPRPVLWGKASANSVGMAIAGKLAGGKFQPAQLRDLQL